MNDFEEFNGDALFEKIMWAVAIVAVIIAIFTL